MKGIIEISVVIQVVKEEHMYSSSVEEVGNVPEVKANSSSSKDDISSVSDTEPKGITWSFRTYLYKPRLLG